MTTLALMAAAAVGLATGAISGLVGGGGGGVSMSVGGWLTWASRVVLFISSLRLIFASQVASAGA